MARGRTTWWIRAPWPVKDTHVGGPHRRGHEETAEPVQGRSLNWPLWLHARDGGLHSPHHMADGRRGQLGEVAATAALLGEGTPAAPLVAASRSRPAGHPFRWLQPGWSRSMHSVPADAGRHQPPIAAIYPLNVGADGTHDARELRGSGLGLAGSGPRGHGSGASPAVARRRPTSLQEPGHDRRKRMGGEGERRWDSLRVGFLGAAAGCRHR